MSAQERLRVLIADNDAAFRGALADVIRGEPTFELVAVADSATEAIESARATQPDVALLDVRMPGGGGEGPRRGSETARPARS